MIEIIKGQPISGKSNNTDKISVNIVPGVSISTGQMVGKFDEKSILQTPALKAVRGEISPAQSLKEIKKQEQSKTTIPSKTYDEDFAEELRLRNKVRKEKEYYENAKANDDRSLLEKLLQIGSSANPVYNAKKDYDKAKKEYEDYKAIKYYSAMPNGEAKTTNPNNKRDYMQMDKSVDWLHEYINNFNDYRKKHSTANPHDGYYKYALMEDREVGIYNYLYNTDVDKAKEFLEFIDDDLNKRLTQKNIETTYKFTQKNDAAAAIGSVASIPINLIAAGEQTVNSINYLISGEIKENTSTKFANAIRTAVTDKYDWEIGNWDAFDFTYNTLMSGADSFAAATMGNVGAVALGLSAAANTTNDIINRGGTAEQAFWGGIAAGVFEGFFEKYSIGELNAMKDSVGSGFKVYASNIAKSMLVNGSEETATEIANILYDYVANDGISQYAKLIEGYMQKNPNASEKSAHEYAAKQLSLQIAEAGISGALMGFGFGALGSVFNYKNADSIGKIVATNGLENHIVDLALKTDENSSAYKLAKKISNSGQMSSTQIGKLAVETMTEFSNKKMNIIADSVRNRMIELGLDESKAENITKRFISVLSGEKVSDTDKNSLKSEPVIKQINSEIQNPENNSWVAEMTAEIGVVENAISQIKEATTISQKPQSQTDVESDTVVDNTANTAFSEAEQRLIDTPDSELTPEQRAVKQTILERQQKNITRNGDVEAEKKDSVVKKGRNKAEKEEALRKGYQQQRNIVSNLSSERQQYLKEKHTEYANILEQLDIGDKLISVDGDIIGEVVTKQDGNLTIIGDGIIEVVLNDTFTDDGVISFLDMGGYFDISIADQIRANQDKLNKMDVVASINTDKKFESKQDVISWALEKLTHLGGKVFHKDFGNIVIDKKRLQNGYKYLKSYEEYVAYSLIGDVIEKGIQGKVRPKHKQRNYDTVTIFAPIEINGVRGNMAIALRIEDGSFYKVHQVLLPNGKRFNPIEKGDTAGMAGLVQTELDLSPTDNISKDSIPDSKEKVNKFTENSDTDYELSDSDQYAKDKSFWTAENKNDTTVSKSLKDKLASLFGKKNDKKTVSISEIVKQIEKEFNIPVSKGKFREKAYGIYKNHSQAIRTKISNALPTIAHELGHHLDNKYGLRYFESIGEAERILKETRPDFYNAYKPEARPREAVAEFIRDYLADRKMAKDKYPFFFEEFERRLSENGKNDLENLKAIGDKINEYYSAELRDRAKSAIISRREAKKLKRMEVKLNDVLTRAETEILDDGAAFKEISDEAYDLYYWAKKSSVRAKNTLTGYYMSGFDEDIVRQRDKDGNVMKDENGNEIYVPALKHILSEIENGTMFDDFNEYLVCRHGIEWLNHDLRVFADDALNTKSYMTERLKNLENQYPQFKETAENLYGWYKTFVYEYGVKSGLMTKEQYKALTEKYPCYVPFMRNTEGKKNGHTKSGVANQNAPIKRAKGSGLEIYSPIESLVIKVEQFMKAADRNAVMQKIADTVDAEDGFGWLLEEVPPDIIPNTISSQVIKDTAKRTLKDSGIDDSAADDFSNLIDELIGESITDFKIGFIQGENVVAVRRNGKRTLYQVHDKNLLAALTGLRPEQFGTITKAFGKVTKVFKALTTGSNAVWSIVSNAPRDFDSAYKYGSENNPIKYTVDYIKAVASQFEKNDTETMKLYRTLGGGYNNSFANAGELQLTLKEMLPRDKNFAERVKGLFNIVNNVTKLADFVETAPRLAEFKRVYERTGDAKKAMLAAEEVTVNFNRSGKFTKTLDQYIPYLNASLQANAKYAKTIAQSFSKDGDKSFLVKSIVTAIIKTGLTFGILALFGDEGEEEYEKLSAYKKNNFYNIYLGNGKFLSIPKSQATGVFDSLLERVFEIARKEDVEWGQEVKDFAGYMWLTFGPPLVDDMIIGSTVLDLAKNENFTGAPIVPSYYENLVPEMQYNEKTTHIAKSIGQLFGWSPMKIDHIIESNFGVFGLINKSLGRAEKDWTLGTKTKVITDNAYSTDILNNFYDKADDYTTKAKSYPDNAEYVYKDKQYTAIKSIVSALNDYGKEDSELAREYKILARDYVDRFEKETKTNKKLCELLEATGNDDILYDKTFKPTYSINKVEYKMTSEEFMEMIDTYYEEVEKEYDEILKMKLSDDSTVRMLISAKEKIYNRVAKDYKKKR